MSCNAKDLVSVTFNVVDFQTTQEKQLVCSRENSIYSRTSRLQSHNAKHLISYMSEELLWHWTADVSKRLCGMNLEEQKEEPFISKHWWKRKL